MESLKRKPQLSKKIQEKEQELWDLKSKIKILEKELIYSNEKSKSIRDELNLFSLHHLLEEGKLLVLMDGLDELSTNELRDIVQSQLLEFSRNYPFTRFILTCRTQVVRIIPSGFTSVEVAEFSPEQVKQFVQNWFTANGQSTGVVDSLCNTIELATKERPELRELTVTPVLLSLVCLVLQDEGGKLPNNKVWLYRKGVKLLLNRWNNEKGIKDWEVGAEVYRQLSLRDKEVLLIEIAAHKFENPKNFVLFEQDELVEQISRKLRLANVQEGIAVLKAIETQHGLLVERADELWSFSHLTFQEYFTVQWLTQLSNQKLAEIISDHQWQNVAEQLVKSQQPADRLLYLIKQAIDRSIAEEPVIQSFISWILQKSSLLQTNYKPTAIRAFYYSLACTLNRNQDQSLGLDRTLALDRALDLACACKHARKRNHAHTRAIDLALDLSLSRSLGLDLTRARASNHDLERDLDRTLARTLAGNRAHNHALDIARTLALDFALTLDLNIVRALDPNLVLDSSRNIERSINLDRYLNHNRYRVFDFALSLDSNLDSNFERDFDLDYILNLERAAEMIPHLRKLKEALPISNRPQEVQQHWWSLHGAQWINQLRQLMIEYRNIGHDWQLTQEHQQQLQHYYSANKFLANLMNIEGAATEDCRKEIEDGLLLPWEELQRRQPHLYGELE